MPTTKFPLQIGGFEVIGSLGQGGMGIVYCARDNTLQRELAIKVQSGDWKNHSELLQRFLREARILAKINHPNVVQIYSVGEHEGAPFFVMELLDGSIADAARLKMPSIPQVKRWMLEAARGLAAIHEMGVVHRDIKPGNLLLTRPTSVEEEHVKVADLGIASAGEQFGAPLTRAGAVLGTSGYLPPESFRLEHTLDSRADQYSLGVVFFELLAKRGPYQDMGDRALIAAIIEPRAAPDVRDFRPEVDAGTAQILARMLKDDPDERFESTQALVQALIQVQGASEPARSPWSDPPAPAKPKLESTPAPTTASAPPATVQRPPSPKKVTPWLILAALLVLVILGVFFARYGRNSSTLPAVGNAPTAAASQTQASAQGEAWAKYVLAHYQLKSWGDEEAWTLDLLDQKAGLLRAELDGPEDATITLTGRVASQSTESMDGAEWDVYRMNFAGAGGRTMEVRIEFAGALTGGEGIYTHDGQRLRFEVVDSEDH